MKWVIGGIYKYTNTSGAIFILRYDGGMYYFTTIKSTIPRIIRGFHGHLNKDQLCRLEYLPYKEAVLEVL